MKKKNYEELTNSIIDLVGGKDNITLFTHCMTRLRFTIKDKSRVQDNEIEKLNGVLGINWAADQLQVIIGQEVSNVYKSICAIKNLNVEKKDSENIEDNKKITFGSLISTISSCVVPVLPILTGAGLVKVTCLLLKTFGLIKMTDPTYITMSMVGDAGFYFLPIFVAWAAAKRFNTSIPTAMLLGAVLISPTFTTAISSGETLSIFGIGIKMFNYSSTVFPIILTVYLLSFVEKFVAKHAPTSFKFMLTSFIPVIVVFPIMLLIIAPLGAILGDYLAIAVEFIYNNFGFLAFGLFAATYPFIIMTGMHTALIPMSTSALATLGYIPFPSVASTVSNINQGIVSAAVGCKTKNKNLKSEAFTFAITAIIGGVTEPAMYGIYFKYKAAMLGAVIGGLLGGCVGGFFKVGTYVMTGTGGIFCLPGYIGPTEMNLIGAVLALLVGAISSFVVTYILYKDESVEM